VNKLPYERQWADFCSERKVRCDSHWPRCGNCTKARRVCQGYGMQLSWPRHGDRKRAITSRDTRRAVNTLQPNVKGFLNSSSWDVSLSEELENGRISGENHLRGSDTLSNCLILTAVACSSLPSDHESPPPDLSIAHRHKQRRVAFSGVLYVG